MSDILYNPIIVTTLMIISPLTIISQIKETIKTKKGVSVLYVASQVALQIYFIFYYISLKAYPIIISSIIAITLLIILLIITIKCKIKQ